ncbi:MAG: YIP1 family protein [Novosphingobium sp.]|jgi:hypothetical protein|nr:YIP1 family protein [Novosphingobium sp.]
MVDLSGVDHKSIVERAKAIILTPKDEWPRIATETTSQGDILKGYVLPLAAIGPVAAFIGGQVFGYGALGFSYRPSLVFSLSSALISFALAIVGVFVLTFIADFLAPKFQGESNRAQAFKLVAYGSTASWLAGVFGLIPSLGFFGLLGLYSIYLIYIGATPLMKVPAEKAGGYTAVTIVCAIVLALIVAPITAAVTGLLTAGPMMAAGSTDSGEVSGTVTVPGIGSIDLDKAQEASKRMEDVANGKVPPIDIAKIQALLPASVGAYQRSATESMAMGAVGSSAQGTYTAGDKSFTLKIADMSALGALSGLGAAMGVQQSREDANGYDRTTTVNGELQSEAWNKSSSSGKFGVTVKNRFLIEAEGSAASIDELKAAVAAINQGELANLAG